MKFITEQLKLIIIHKLNMKKKGIKKKEPSWFNEPPTEEDKSFYRKALAVYLAREFTKG